MMDSVVLMPSAMPNAVESTSHPIRISTLGTLLVVRHGHVVEGSDWHTRQARQLLKILITERPRPVSTDRLIELLWPESRLGAAATTLRSAVNALRNVLEPDRAKRAPSRYIHTQTPGYAFHEHSDIWLDSAVFESHLDAAQAAADANGSAAAHLQAAIALYRDDYLSSDPYADWAQPERERLRERYFTALLHLSTLHGKEGKYGEAIALCRRILAQDEVRENAYQAIMRYQAASGDSAGALVTYERCRTVLADELGADPSPVTQTLHARILDGDLLGGQLFPENGGRGPGTVNGAHASADGSVPPTAPTERDGAPPLPQQVLMPALDENLFEVFVGRADELARMRAQLEEAHRGRGKLTIVEGEAGVGKTRLAYHLLQTAGESGFTVISATCQMLERGLPFAPLADSLGRYLAALPDAALHTLPDASLAQIVQIIPSVRNRLPELPSPLSDGGLNSEENRHRLIDGIVSLVAALAEACPLVLFLDDLQWADPDTLAVLSRLSQRLAHVPLLVLLAYRSEDAGENRDLVKLLRAVKRSHPSSVLNLNRFTPQHVQTFVEKLTGDTGPQSAEFATLLYETTSGNALFITEALHALADYRATSGDESWSTAYRQKLNLRRNQRVQEIILERLERLPEQALDVLQLSAVIGRDFSLDLLEVAFSGDPIAGLELLLQRKFLIERPDDRLDFSHEMVRQVAYDSMSTLQRRRLHRRIGDALVALNYSGQNPGEIAFHYSHAGRDARALYARYSVLAGEKVIATFGFRQAIEHFDDALFVLNALPGAETDLVRRALQGSGLAHEGLFDPVGIADSYGALQQWAKEHDEQALLLSAHNRMTTMLALTGQQRESNELLLELLDTMTQGDEHTGIDSQVLADLAERRQRIYRVEPETDDGRWAAFCPPPPAIADPVVQLERVLGPLHAVLPLIDYGWILRIQGQLDEAVQCLGAAVQLAHETSQRALGSTAYHQLAVISTLRGDEETGRTLNEKSIALNREGNHATTELVSMWPRISSAFQALRSGQYGVAERRLLHVIDYLGGRDAFRTHRNSANIGLGLVAIEYDERERAEELLTSALEDTANLYPYTYVRALLGLARLARDAGDVQRAEHLLRRALRFAGPRSLIEEYAETLLTLAQWRIADGSISELLHEFLPMVEAAGLHPTARLLRAQQRHLLGQ